MSQILNTSTDTSWKDADTLISILRTWGIEYLLGLEQASSPSQIEQLSPIALIKRLAQQSENSRIRDASISLFLLHPEITDAIVEAIETSEPAIIEVFYFDFYSIALSKIERGTTRDIEDVKLLVQQQRIALDELDATCQEVLAQLGKGRYPKITPERFAERYAAIRPLRCALGLPGICDSGPTIHDNLQL